MKDGMINMNEEMINMQREMADGSSTLYQDMREILNAIKKKSNSDSSSQRLSFQLLNPFPLTAMELYPL